MAKPYTNVEAVSNGLGSQSMFLLVLAARGEIPATVSFTADTGAEQDCLWSTGERTTAREYFERIVHPYAESHGIAAKFIRSLDKFKQPLPDLMTHLKQVIAEGKMKSAKIPLFGSRGGRLMQVCTEKWKSRAIRQEARRMGATHLVTAQGIHFGEGRRVKGRIKRVNGEWTIYQDVETRKVGGEKVQVDVQWCEHYYPLFDRRMGRKHAVEALEAERIPYLVSSQCDHCPHKDLPRWERTSPAKLVEIAAVEASMQGQFFFTDRRVPLMEALEMMRKDKAATLDTNFGCGNSYCGI